MLVYPFVLVAVCLSCTAYSESPAHLIEVVILYVYCKICYDEEVSNFSRSVDLLQYDINTQKRFLCTTLKENDISVADLYIGNSITLCGRLLSLVDYGDEYTRRKLGAQKQRSVCVSELLSCLQCMC